MKDLIATICFGKVRTYITITKRNADFFELIYLNTTTSGIDLNNLEHSQSVDNINELNAIMLNFADGISKLFVVVDTPDAFVSTFPSSFEDDISNITELLKFEIRQNFPDKSISDFSIKIIDQFSQNNENMLIASMIPNDIINACKQITDGIGLDITDINISTLTALNAYLFNYPEEINEPNLIVSIDEKTIEFGMLLDNKARFYDIAMNTQNNQTLPEIIENKANQAMFMADVENFKNIFVLGQNLNKSKFFECWEIGALLGSDTKRLNPLRMFKTSLGKREREYCARTFHLFASCIGGGLPLHFNYKIL